MRVVSRLRCALARALLTMTSPSLIDSWYLHLSFYFTIIHGNNN
jgi:hypothetical protein